MEIKYLVYISFLFLAELNKEYFILEIFKENLLALNQFATFSKRFPILESEINKFVSSANIIGVSLLELLKRSYIRMESCGTPQVILRHAIFVSTE